MDRIDAILMDMSFLDKEPEENQSLKGDLGLDSLKIVELIVVLEDAFQIQIDESDLEPAALQTVGDIHELITRYIEVKSFAI